MALKLVAFDMDGTIIHYPHSEWGASWDTLGLAAGKKEEFERRLKFYLPKMETSPDPAKLYETWVREDCSSLAGIPFSQVESHLFPIPYIIGFQQFCTYVKEKENFTGIISGGVDLVARRIQEENDLDFVIANEVELVNGVFTGKGKMNLALSDAHQEYNKSAHFLKILAQYGINPSESAFIGDSSSDIPAWQLAGTRISINPKHYDLWKHKVKNLQVFDDFNQVMDWFKSKKF